MARRKKAKPQYRSKFEAGLAERLERARVPFSYESETFPIQMTVVGAACSECGERKRIFKASRYTPDFFFPRWIIEAKGKFTARDRKRVMCLLGELAHRGDGRRFGLLFMRDNKLSKTSKIRYSDWCRTHAVPYAIGWFDEEWLK